MIPEAGDFYAFKSALPKIKAACSIMLKYSVLNNMLRRMKNMLKFSLKYQHVLEKICTKIKNIKMFLGRFLVSYSLIAPYM